MITTESLNTRLIIRKQSDLFPNEIDLLKSAQLDGVAPVEAWTAEGTNKELSYATHGSFRYFGKFPPPIATHLIAAHTEENDLVWDPMCGSGTTGVESLLLGRKCMLNDVNPLSRLLARVKTRYIAPDQLKHAVQNIADHYRPIEDTDDYKFDLIGLRNPGHWFLPETKKSLLGLRKLIECEKDEKLQEFLWLVFAATVRRVSRATTQQGRLFLDAETALEDALPTFLKRAAIAIEGISSLPPNGESRVKIESFNLADSVPEDYKESTGLVILHPPYFNSYKYTSVNSLELAWLGYNLSEIRKNEIREFFKVGKPENVVHYVEDMYNATKNAVSLLKPNGKLGLMIGDTIMKGQHIPVTKMLLDKLIEENIEVETIALRVPKYTEATWVASQRRNGQEVGITLYDYVLTLRRI